MTNVIGDEQEAMMVRYLLGLATEEERTEVEERYFSEAEYFDQLLALEESLIDDFVTGRMPAEQRSAFKESFDLRKEDIRFGQALIQGITKKKLHRVVTPTTAARPGIPNREGRRSTSTSRRYGIAASIAAAVLLMVAVAFFLRSQELRRQLSDSRIEAAELKEANATAQRELDAERSLKESSTRELESERNKRIEAESRLSKIESTTSPGGLLDFIRIRLTAAFISRGSGSATGIRVPQNIHWLRFEIPVQPYSQYESYRVSIKPVGQKSILEKTALQASGQRPIVVATIAADELKPGDYILTLYGEKASQQPVALEEYSFRIQS